MSAEDGKTHGLGIYGGYTVEGLIARIGRERPDVVARVKWLAELDQHIPDLPLEDRPEVAHAGYEASLRTVQEVLAGLVADDVLKVRGVPDTIPPNFGQPPDTQQRFEGEQ